MPTDDDQPADPRIQAILPDLQAACAHHQAGRLDEAERGYEAILRTIPDLGDALQLLGLLALKRGDPARAATLIAKAIRNLPEDFAEAHLNLGNAYAAMRQPVRAEASYRQAIAIDPEFAEAHVNLAGIQNLRGGHAEALESCEAALKLDSELIEAYLNKAVALRTLRRFPEAEAPLREALARQPDRAGTCNDLATLLCELQRFEEAAAFHEKAIALQPANPDMRIMYSLTLVRMGNASIATEHAKQAVALAPDAVNAWIALGGAERALGHFDDACDHFRRALDIDPSRSDARWHLMFIGRQSSDSPEAERLKTILARADTPMNDRIAAGFSLGKVYDDADEYDNAFAAFSTANALLNDQRVASGEMFDPVHFANSLGNVARTYPKSLFRRVAHWGSGSDLPVFVVGMPRSGTTLVEQIAASHSQVFGAGELSNIGQIGRRIRERNHRRPRIEDWDAMDARREADAHVGYLRSLGGQAIRVIDKLPDNAFLLGLISALFPRARVIVVQRDPRDCGLSNFFQFFTSGNLYSYDLHNCGVRARETARLLRHWREALPIRLLTVQYEELVADLEGQTRRLIDFLGLEWENACLDFHKTERTVNTPSQWQVRQPIYTRSVGRWRHYEQYLGPMFEALKDRA